MSELILYTSDDGQSHIQLRTDGQTVWLTQLEVAELFLTTKQNVAKHLKAIFSEGELSQDSVVNYWLTTAADGKNYRVAHYPPSCARKVVSQLLWLSGRRGWATLLPAMAFPCWLMLD